MAGVEGVGAVLAEKEEPARQSGAAIDADHGLRANAPRPRAEQGMAALDAAQLDLLQNSRGHHEIIIAQIAGCLVLVIMTQTPVQQEGSCGGIVFEKLNQSHTPHSD